MEELQELIIDVAKRLDDDSLVEIYIALQVLIGLDSAIKIKMVRICAEQLIA